MSKPQRKGHYVWMDDVVLDPKNPPPFPQSVVKEFVKFARRRERYRRVPCAVCGGRMRLDEDLNHNPIWVCTGTLGPDDPCLETAAKQFNDNPRLGVTLRHGNASKRLVRLLWRWRMRGLVSFLKEWPLARLRKELFGFGPNQQAELTKLINPPTGVLRVRRQGNFLDGA